MNCELCGTYMANVYGAIKGEVYICRSCYVRYHQARRRAGVWIGSMQEWWKFADAYLLSVGYRDVPGKLEVRSFSNDSSTGVLIDSIDEVSRIIENEGAALPDWEYS